VSQCPSLGYSLHPTILQSPKCFSDPLSSHPQSLAQPPLNQSIPLHVPPLKMHLPTLLATIPLIALTLASNLPPPPPPQNNYTTDCAHPSQSATCGTSTVPVTSDLCDGGICTCNTDGTLVCTALDDLCTGEMLQAVCLASFECSCVILTDPCSGFPGCGVGPGHGL
jgi:hypothetical protein